MNNQSNLSDIPYEIPEDREESELTNEERKERRRRQHEESY